MLNYVETKKFLEVNGMEVIRHLLQVKVDDGNYVYVNTLNGLVDIVNEEDHQIIKSWQKNSEVITHTPHTIGMCEYMKERGYIVQNRAEEEEIKQQFLERMRINLKKAQKTVSQIRLVLTYDCNFRCVYCYEEHVQKNGVDWVEETMSREMVDLIKERYGENLKWVTLFGGEPLLLKNWELVEYVLESFEDVVFGVTTNGYTIEEYVPLLKKFNFGLVEITIDGTEENHNKRRCLANGEGTYAKVIRGIDVAVKSELPVQLRMTVDDTNFEGCTQLFTELAECYRDYSNFKVFRNATFGEIESKICRSEVLTNLFLNEEKMQKYKEHLSAGLDEFHSIGRVFQGSGKWSPKFAFCSAHQGQHFLDPHGDIYTCWLALGKKELRLGTYYPQAVIDEKSPWLERTVENLTPCNQCPLALLCGGGCANAVYASTGDLMERSCEQTKLLIDKVIPMLYRKYVQA